MSNVWCTLVMLNDSYAAGAAIVARSLKAVKTKYPVWCMCDSTVSEDCFAFLSEHFDRVIRVPLISYPCTNMKSKKQDSIYGKWINNSFTKFNIMNPELFPVEKVIFVDADTLFTSNCDELFKLPGNALTFSSPWISPFTKGNGRRIAPNPYGIMKHGQVVNPKHILSAFNGSVVGLACMMLIVPDDDMYATTMEILTRKSLYGNPRCMSGFDEQLIAEVLIKIGKPIYHIHQRYNWIADKYNWLEACDEPRLIQWYNDKPWTCPPENGNKWPCDLKWWDCAKNMIDEHPESRRWIYLSVKE